MKIAITVPNPIFEAGERSAERLGVSRSHLYATALRAYLERHEDDEVTRCLNEVYDQETSGADPVLTRLAPLVLPRESWPS